jgi:hypothetical protein
MLKPLFYFIPALLGLFNINLIGDKSKNANFAVLNKRVIVKLFVKISFWVLLAFNLSGSYGIPQLRNIQSHQNELVTHQVSFHVLNASSINQGPVPLKIFRRFQHGIDEAFFTITDYSKGKIFFNANPSLNDISFYQSWVKYFHTSCRTMPGYETHLSSLPLRSPPIS